MKISDILKRDGVFSKEISSRFKNNQIKINGEIIPDDIELNVVEPQWPNPMLLFDKKIPFEAGEWLFVKILSKLTDEKRKTFLLFVDLFGIETLFSGDCQINNKPIEEILPELNVLKGHIFLKTSKKQMFILKLL